MRRLNTTNEQLGAFLQIYVLRICKLESILILGEILLGIGAILTGVAAINDSFNPKKKKKKKK